MDRTLPAARTTGAVAPQLTTDDFDKLVHLNRAVAGELLKSSDRVKAYRRGGNGLLILSGFAYALVNENAPGSDDLAAGLLIALGLSEGMRYYGGAKAHEALLLAADQSNCIASAGASRMDDRGTPDLEDVALLWEVTFLVQTNLRRAVSRKSVSIVSLIDRVTGAENREDAEYDLTVATARLKAYERYSGAAEKTFPRRLWGCLAQSNG
ncbi:hypothetical protein [Jannaschia sp. M317]|uniref:hypothetical protein n=1 Tax=Jannaschia sp. M317 TaxID=2867011 RepID=UPI0021A7B7B8|nr:hypothetical protein [Jannaschia sp. M317]UWQ19182.1 hypothetical protein K3551_07895 [Jannaschia sp. M317]